MALFRFVLMNCVLRGFSACDILDVGLAGNPLPAIANAQARRAGLCGLLNTLIFVKLDVKSHLAALIKKNAHSQIVNELLVSIH
jgi:hypothetical protein